MLLKRLSKLLPAIANLMLFGKTKNNGISPYKENVSFFPTVLGLYDQLCFSYTNNFSLSFKCSLGRSQVRSKAYRVYWTLRSEYQMTAETKVKDKLKNRKENWHSGLSPFGSDSFLPSSFPLYLWSPWPRKTFLYLLCVLFPHVQILPILQSMV